jgi:hypothetical protein
VADARLNVGAVSTLQTTTFTEATAVTGSGSATFSGYSASGTGSGGSQQDARVRVGAGATLAGPLFVATASTLGVRVGKGVGLKLLARGRLVR